MISTKKVIESLSKHGTCKQQISEDWNGNFELPDKLHDFYCSVGPINININGYGNPYHLPSLKELWNQQAGYRYNGITNERIPHWQDNWIVVASEGADPFIYNCDDSKIYYAQHGAGNWNVTELFASIEEMVVCLSVIGEVVNLADDDFLDDDFLINRQWVEKCSEKLNTFISSKEKVEFILDQLGWGEASISQ